jgi:hypothetical protein
MVLGAPIRTVTERRVVDALQNLGYLAGLLSGGGSVSA